MKKTKYTTNQNNPQIRAYKEAVRQGMKNQHVVPQENGWAVKRAGSSRASGVYGTQSEAIRQASSIARNQGTSVYIHGENGRIRESRSY